MSNHIMNNLYVNDFSTTVKTYYDELKKCKPLSREEERELIFSAKNGDLNAQNKVLTANLKFVFSVASRYKGKGVPLNDLISEGNVGLIKAMQKFDVTKDVKFISYAVWWIKNAIQEFIKKQQSITMYEKDDEELNAQIRKVSLEDDEDEVVNKRDTILSDEPDKERNEANRKQKKIVDEILSKLDDRERYIVQCYYGINRNKEMNLEEIGIELNLTKERVRQIKAVALTKLRSDILMIEGADLIF